MINKFTSMFEENYSSKLILNQKRKFIKLKKPKISHLKPVSLVED
jgi:hypothetical protein